MKVKTFKQPNGWEVEAHIYEADPEGDIPSDKVNFMLRSPQGHTAIYYDIDGDNGLAFQFLRDLIGTKLPEPFDAGEYAAALGENGHQTP